MKLTKNNLKKYIVSFVMLLVILLTPFFATGCFIFEEEADEFGYASAKSVLDGVKVNYIKSKFENNEYSKVNDENFLLLLKQQYLDLSSEILINLCAVYGMGIDSITVNDIYKKLTKIYGDYGSNKVCYDSYIMSVPGEGETVEGDYNLIQRNSWKFAPTGSFASNVDYTVAFCSEINLYKMQAALYLINLGYDINDGNYGGQGEYFSFTGDLANKLNELLNNPEISHTGLLQCEIDTLITFVLNEVIGSNYSAISTDVTKIINDTLTQMSRESGMEGVPKYQIVAGIYTKDFSLKDISPEDSFFTMDLGQQYYKSLIFLFKKEIKLTDIVLTLQSDNDMILDVDVRLYNSSIQNFVLNERLSSVEIHKGKYDDLDRGLQGEIQFDFNKYMQKVTSDYENYKIGPFNNDLHLNLFENLFSHYGKPLTIAKNGFFTNLSYELNLNARYKVEKEKITDKTQINYTRKGLVNECDYLEFVFSSETEFPFEIGFMFFDYRDISK